MVLELDKEGYFIISIRQGHIIAEHYSNEKKLKKVYRAKTANSIHLQITNDDGISLKDHSLYLMTELKKAEVALRTGNVYVQE